MFCRSSLDGFRVSAVRGVRAAARALAGIALHLSQGHVELN